MTVSLASAEPCCPLGQVAKMYGERRDMIGQSSFSKDTACMLFRKPGVLMTYGVPGFQISGFVTLQFPKPKDKMSHAADDFQWPAIVATEDCAHSKVFQANSDCRTLTKSSKVQTHHPCLWQCCYKTGHEREASCSRIRATLTTKATCMDGGIGVKGWSKPQSPNQRFQSNSESEILVHCRAHTPAPKS